MTRTLNACLIWATMALLLWVYGGFPPFGLPTLAYAPACHWPGAKKEP